jgi:tetratricopeptide (TPR) repeat protein
MFTQLLKEFLNELELTKGRNCLLSVIVDGSSGWIEDKVEEHGFTVYRIDLSKKDRLFKLVDILLKWKETGENTVYFVYGMMNQAPDILTYLNLHRDFLYDIKRPIVVVGSMYDMHAISALAPDLWRFRSRTYDFSEKGKEIQPRYVPSLPAMPLEVREASLLLSWGEEELKRRIDLDEYLLEAIKDDYRRSELHKSLATYYSVLDDFDKLDENLNMFRELRQDNDVDISTVYRELGDLCFLRNRLKEALEYYSKAIELDPENERAYHNRGDVHYELKMFEEAITDYDKAIELDPRSAVSYKNRGNAYFKLYQFDKAIADYDKAIEIDADYALAYNNRGMAYYELYQFDKAIADYDKAIEIDADYALTYKHRGFTYFRLHQFEKAIADLDKAMELDSDLADAYNDRGVVYYELNQFEKAIADYDKAIELDPGYALAYNNLGDIYFRLNQFEKAFACLDKAIELDPGLAIAHCSRGDFYSRLGDYEKAVKDLKKAGILFLKSMKIEYSIEMLSQCFDLRHKIENSDIIYCGLLLYLLTSDASILTRLKELNIKDELLKQLFELVMKKLHDKDISRDLEKLKGKEDIHVLLEALKRFQGHI